MSAPARFGQYLYANLTSAIFGPPTPTAAMSDPPNPEDEEHSSSRIRLQKPGEFAPFLADVLEVKNDLCKGLKIPMELVDAIVDYAEYWPHTTTVRTKGEMAVRTGRGREEEMFVLRSYPLGYLPKETDTTECRMLDEHSYPTIEPKPWSTTKEVEGVANEDVKAKWLVESNMKSDRPCRKIVFTIRSHDQGWGGGIANKGTYRGSYTWFDAGKEELVAFKPGQEPSPLPPTATHTLSIPSEPQEAAPITCTFHTIFPTTDSNQTSSDDTDIQYHFYHPLEPNTYCLQRNVTAEKTLQTHIIEWRCDDDTDPDSLSGIALEEIGRGRGTATGEFVRNMRVGDVVTVWAKARFAAWANIFEEVKIDVYWAV